MTDTIAIREVGINFSTEKPEEGHLVDSREDVSTTAEQKTKEKRSRLSRAATKLKDGVRTSIITDQEKLTDREYTQEELLALVKTADAEVLKEALEELDRKGITPEVLAEIGAIDIEALAQEATMLTESIQQNEEGLAAIAAKEKNGKKVPKEEFLTLWQERGELMDNLCEIEWQRRAYTTTIADKAMAGMMQKLFAPLNNLILRMWKELNRTNPQHVALPALRSAAYAKTRKAHEGKWGFKEEHQYRKWRKEASPEDLAIRITQLQMASASPMPRTAHTLAA